VREPAEALHRELVDVFERSCRLLPGACFERDGGYVFISYPTAPLPMFNGVWSGEDDAAAAAALERELERVRASDAPPGVCVLDDRAPRLLAEARRLGLSETLTIPGMIVDASAFRPVRLDGVEIEVVRGDDALAEACAVMASGFEVPTEWFSEMYREEVLADSVVYIVRAGGRAVSTAVAYQGRTGVGIFNVATPEPDRGRGYGAAVTSRAVEDGLAAGADFAFLQSSPPGEPVYRRLGFEQVSTYTLAFGG
jgi:hypothetical protein